MVMWVAERTALGQRIAELRRIRRQTQRELAERIGVSPQTISNWENGVSHVPSADLPNVAAELRVTVAQLYEETDAGARSGSAQGRAGARGQTTGIRGPARIPAPDSDPFNAEVRTDDPRAAGVKPLPVYRWGSLGDPRDQESAPFPDRMDYPPTGKESLVGPNGFAVDVRGDSMTGRGIQDGDTCWVNPDRPYRLGQVVLASVDTDDGESGMVIKTYARTEVGECLMSDTAAGRSPLVCKQYRIIGPVVLIQPRSFPPR